MSLIQPIYSDRTRYKLSHNPTGTQTIQEPVGWRDDDTEFIRDKAFHGIFPMMTNNLKFYNDGSLFIQSIYKEYGVNADLILIKEERNPITDIWELSYSGFLDLTTYIKFNGGMSIKFISSGLLRVIKARQNEKIELDRLETLDGKVVPYLEPKQVSLQGRNIFLKTLLETEAKNSASNIFRVEYNDGNRRFGLIAIPVTKIYSSDIKTQMVPKDLSFRKGAPSGDEENGRVEEMFYADNDRDKTLNVEIECSFDIADAGSNDLSNSSMYLTLTTFKNSTDYNLKTRENLTSTIFTGNSVVTPFVTINITKQITLLKGESLSLQVYAEADFGDIFSRGDMYVNFSNIITTIKIEEYSTFNPTVNKVHLPFEVCNRFLELLTDQKDILISNAFGRAEMNDYSNDGIASLTGIMHGFWVRGFSKEDTPGINDENRYKSLSTSFKDFYEAYFNVWNLGASIENIGFKEFFRIEKLDYFYNDKILIRLGKTVNGKFEYIQVSNVQRTIDKDAFSSALDIGYDKGGDYEEAIGLDEYNTRTNFTTVINKIEKTYIAISKYRADSYGMEFARRFQKSNYPTDDTKYDNSIWLVDMKKGLNDVFQQRLWQDDFEVEPTGVFDPPTAQNLRLSPFNILLRHGWRVASGFVKYPFDYIRYGSSVANSGLVTELKVSMYPEYGGVSYAENGNIQNQELEKARMDGEIVEFDFPVDYNLLQKVRGKTLILGKQIPNFYGLVSFKNEDGKIEEGYLDKLSPNGVGKWTLKKFNK